jgi:cobalt-zinc-cadmium efflux system protein
MTSEHTHSHTHNHSHAPAGFNQAFAIGIVLNTVFVLIEGFYGWKINSLALLADAGHNLSDVAGLLLAWGGVLAGQRRPDARYTYGFKRASILAAFVNAVVLLLAWVACSTPRPRKVPPSSRWPVWASSSTRRRR